MLLRCPQCKTTEEVDNTLAGKLVSCPRCARAVQLPGGSRGRAPKWLDHVVEASSKVVASPRRRAWGVVIGLLVALAIAFWVARAHFGVTFP